MATFASHLPVGGLHSARAAANAVPAGTLYYETDTKKIFQSDGVSTWTTWADLSALGGAMATDTLWDTKGDLAVATGADAASKLAVGSNGQVLTADSTQTTGVKWGAAGAGAMTLICSSVLSGAQATFDTNTLLGGNIPGTYNHLQYMVLARDTGAGTSASGLSGQFNADTASNYDSQYYYGNNTTMTAAQQIGATSMIFGVCQNGGAAAGLFAQTVGTILGYANTTANKIQTATAYSKAGTSSADFRTWNIAGDWRNTAAITRIVITSPATNFAIGSQFYLYGIT